VSAKNNNLALAANLKKGLFSPFFKLAAVKSKIVLGGLFLCLLLLGLFFFREKILPVKYRLYEAEFLAMGTFFKLQIYKKDDLSKEILERCVQRLNEIERQGNIFDKDSLISKINRAGQKGMKVSDDLFKVISIAYEAAVQTKGAFDITVKPLVDYYQIKNYKEEFTEEFEINKQLLKRVGYQNIHLGKEQRIVKLINKAQIDLSGILKGYAVDELVCILKRAGIEKALINGGGNIYAIGTNENGEAWQIGIRDPNNKQEIAKIIELSNQAVATSGGYERYIVVKNKKYAHIIDPRDGKLIPAQGSVTVVTDKAIWADVLSTAIYVDRDLKISFAKIFLLN
jgi:thiamine biosynthesis lipoprotein